MSIQTTDPVVMAVMEKLRAEYEVTCRPFVLVTGGAFELTYEVTIRPLPKGKLYTSGKNPIE